MAPVRNTAFSWDAMAGKSAVSQSEHAHIELDRKRGASFPVSNSGPWQGRNVDLLDMIFEAPGAWRWPARHYLSPTLGGAAIGDEETAERLPLGVEILFTSSFRSEAGRR